MMIIIYAGFFLSFRISTIISLQLVGKSGHLLSPTIIVVEQTIVTYILVSLGYRIVFDLVNAGVLKLIKDIRYTNIIENHTFCIINHDIILLYSTHKSGVTQWPS
jgi:hypothetical protein